MSVYYTDYTTTVAYNTSNIITAAAVSNEVADLLVAHAGATLITHATEGTASSVTNYAEISLNGIYYRFYTTSTTLGYMEFRMSYTSNGTALSSNTFTFAAVASTRVTVTLRFYNAKYGYCVAGVNASTTAPIFFNIPCTRLSTGTSYYAGGVTINASVGVAVSDDLSTICYFTSSGLMGNCDYDGVCQLLTQAAVGPVSTTQKRYLLSGVYSSYQMVYTGVVLVDNRYFYIYGYFAIELAV